MNSSIPDAHADRSDPAAAETPFAWIGGESRVHALTERFYDLMDLEPGYAALRATHGSTLADARQPVSSSTAQSAFAVPFSASSNCTSAWQAVWLSMTV